MFEMSPAIDKLAPALVAVQTATFGVEKNSNNPHFRSRYADLAATNAACRDALTANGFTVSQWPGEYDGKAMAMTTILLHTSGQWMRGTMTVPLGKQDAQGYGSALTYARRYSLQAVVGLSPEDDDGNAAVRPAPKQKPADDADQGEPNRKTGVKLDGPYKSITALEAAIKAFVSDMGKVADLRDWYGLKNEAGPLLAQAERDHPDWWNGWATQPDGFTPLRRKIEILEAQLGQAADEREAA